MELGSPALQVDSLLSEPQGKSKNTGLGSLPLLQGIFLTQKLNFYIIFYLFSVFWAAVQCVGS